MQKVRLVEGEITENWTSSISAFVQAAHAQGFDAGWVESVLMEAIVNQCVNFKGILLEHVEIIPIPQSHVQADPAGGWLWTNEEIERLREARRVSTARNGNKAKP